MTASERLVGSVLHALLLLAVALRQCLSLVWRLFVFVLLLPLMVVTLPWAIRDYRRLGVAPSWRRWRMRCAACNVRGFSLLDGAPGFPTARLRCTFCNALMDAQGAMVAPPQPDRKGTRADCTGYVLARTALKRWPVGEYREGRDVLGHIVGPYASALGALSALDLMVRRGILAREGRGYRRISEADGLD